MFNKNDLLELSDIYKELIKNLDETNKEINQNIQGVTLIIDILNQEIESIKILKSLISKVSFIDDFENTEYFLPINDKFDLEIKLLEKYSKNQEFFIKLQEEFKTTINEEKDLLNKLMLFITKLKN